VHRANSFVTEAFYFGCKRGVGGDTQAGHHLYDESYRTVYGRDRGWADWGCGPFDALDAALAPRPSGRYSEAPQGHAALHHRDGWTAISFWDRSGDSRGNSNSTFIFNAELTFDEALAEAHERFPALFERFPFEIVEWVP
jgi:hypothetical protein